jgi:signal transduction histidine kinase
MKLRTRLLVFGALVPTLLMAVGFVATGVLLNQHFAHLAYAGTAGVVLLVTSLVLFMLQRGQAARISARIESLATHASRLRGEEFEAPATDAVGDVITDLRDALAKATDRLHASNDAEKRLVADAANELRAPLVAMRASMDQTLRHERSDDELRDALVTARSEIDRLAELANELFELAGLRDSSVPREVVDMHALVNETARALGPMAMERKVRFLVNARGSHPLVRAVPAQVRRAILNLVRNAVRFTPSGTDVRVDIEDAQGTLRISVTDEGESVAPEESTAIFEPFRRGAAKSGRSAGLGLAMVRDVARRHGGDAWVAPGTPRGACFTFEIGSTVRVKESA